MSIPSLLNYGFRNAYRLLIKKRECRMVCIPASFLDKLRDTAIRELEATGIKDPFLTDNDLIVAWWTRVGLAHISQDSDRPVTVQVAMSLRKTLEQELLSEKLPYVSNCFGFTNMVLPSKSFRERLIGDLAATFRATINEQRTRRKIEAYAAMMRNSMATLPTFMGDGATYQVTYTNWTKAGLYQADFSAVAVNPRNTPLFPSYIAHFQVPFQFPEGFVITGRDSKRNTWLCGYRVQGLWEQVEKDLEVLKDL